MRSRIDVKKELLKPSYPAIPDSFGKDTPKWSFKQKHLDKDWTRSPGPKYVPPEFGTDGKRWSCTPARGRDIGMGNLPSGPGAGKYEVRGGPDGPKWSFKVRQFPPDEIGPEGPGGGKYLPNYERILPSDLKGRVILERFHERKPDEAIPLYDLGSTNHGRRSAIGVRPPLEVLVGSAF
jgi:hypothetical protein